jgi:glycosyltransferase involved in cell wall biosynthesis
MATTPLVSVCIPAYRGAAHIGETIRSVLGQTLDALELVIIDDNSPDDTARVVQAFDDPRIRFLRNTANLGPEGNWNRALDEARGTYFKLLPQDDLLHPDCLRRQVAVLQGDEAGTLAMVFAARNIINAEGKLQTVRGYPGGQDGRLDGRSVIRHCVRRGTNLLGEPGSVLMRLATAREVGHFNGAFSYVIDLEYWFRLLLRGDAWYINEPLSSFRISRNQWSVVIGRGQSRDFSRFVDHASRDPNCGIGRVELAIGHNMARLNNLLRLIYYKFVLK